MQNVRQYAELIVQRSEHLPLRDRLLLQAVYGDGRTVKEVAGLIGEEPRRLRRRVSVLTRRVLSDRYIFVLRHRETWPALRRRLATACWVHGRSIKGASEEARTSFYNARKQLDAVQALLDSIRRSRFTTEHTEGQGEERRVEEAERRT